LYPISTIFKQVMVDKNVFSISSLHSKITWIKLLTSMAVFVNKLALVQVFKVLCINYQMIFAYANNMYMKNTEF